MASEPLTASARTSPDDLLSAVALSQFATVGFAGASLQRIADEAGYSKSSVLYHFASKEALLAAVLEPAVTDLERILDGWLADADSPEARTAFLAAFVDLLLQYRLEVHIFINQGPTLPDVDVVERANVLIGALAAAVCPPDSTVEDRLRFGLALGGAAYTLTAGITYGGGQMEPDDELRPALVKLIGELLAPVPALRPTAR